MSATELDREGSLEAPTRHPLNWETDEFYDESALMVELERVFDICHGCRRCFSLCEAFPTLFDAIDESDTMELDGVEKAKFWDVVDQCYLCDMCYMSKCPYVPPHQWNVDFPHLMLRAKANRFKKQGASFRDKLLSSTETIGKLAGIPVVSQVVNKVNQTAAMRGILDRYLGVHKQAHIPRYTGDTLRKKANGLQRSVTVTAGANTRGKVALFTTCYANYNEPQIGEDLIAIYAHNGIEVICPDGQGCCGMPKLELGDLDAVAKAKDINIPILSRMVDQGWDIVTPVPSCTLMFKQELPLLFPEDEAVKKVKQALFDPFEYLFLRHKEQLLQTNFATALGKIAYHVPCHLRVQNIGMKTRELLQLVPDTEVQVIERCSGHDGTYGVKREFYANATKICKPVVNRIESAAVDYYSSDCPIAGHHIANGLANGSAAIHPLSLLRKAYGI